MMNHRNHMTFNALACSAMSFLRDHEAEHLTHDQPRLVDRCIAHLVEICAVSQTTAYVATMQALGELEARHCKASIDCTRTTSFALFLTSENGIQTVITAAALADLVKKQPFMRLQLG
jgi:hypothetical protein